MTAYRSPHAPPGAELRSRRALVDLIDTLGMSEREVARRAGLGHATVNHLVTGRRTGCSPATARAVAAVLGCDPVLLFTGMYHGRNQPS